ncbi:MAG: hypothetical protein ACK5UP_14830 [Bacteroidota bacterium]|jgi:hypothetical protein|nr:hypothetical protein [Flammeovirgaceae bacterium]MCZ8069372.1 hypothetical protein [Cytophagales bacterium]
METFVAIKYQQLRDFSEKINVTFYFIRQNFKSLGKALVFIAGPPALMVSLVLGNFIGEFLQTMQAGVSGTDASSYFLSVGFWMQILLMLFFGVLAYVFTLAVIYNYVLLYEERQSNQIEVSLIWDRVRATFWMYLGTTLFFAVMLMVAYLFLILPVVLLAAISPILIFFGIMGAIVAIIYLVVAIVPTFIVRAYEKRGIFSAISRAFFLIKGKWWSTAGLVFVLSMIAGVISYIFLIPYYIVIFTSALHQAQGDTFSGPTETMLLVTKIFFGIYYLAQILLSTLTHVGISFQYFNLVEIKEARGLMSDIEKFGQAPEASTSQREEQY